MQRLSLSWGPAIMELAFVVSPIIAVCLGHQRRTNRDQRLLNSKRNQGQGPPRANRAEIWGEFLLPALECPRAWSEPRMNYNVSSERRGGIFPRDHRGSVGKSCPITHSQHTRGKKNLRAVPSRAATLEFLWPTFFLVHVDGSAACTKQVILRLWNVFVTISIPRIQVNGPRCDLFYLWGLSVTRVNRWNLTLFSLIRFHDGKYPAWFKH